MRILGIDPGTATIGFGVIEYHEDQCTLLDYGCIKTEKQFALPERLRQIHQDLESLLKEWKPETVAIEDIFFSKNVKTAIQVAQARGAILQQFASKQLSIGEYKPQQIKEAVCGYGKAEKKQIQKMVQLILKMDETPEPDDAADALAIAICHAHQLGRAKMIALADTQSLQPAYT